MCQVSLLAETKLLRATATSWMPALCFSTDCCVVWRLLFMEGAPSSNLVCAAQGAVILALSPFPSQHFSSTAACQGLGGIRTHGRYLRNLY